MSLRDELTRACIGGPKALQALIKANGLELGATLNVLRVVLRAVVLEGAQTKVLTVLAKHLKGLTVTQEGSGTISAITELIAIERELSNVWSTQRQEYIRRQPDPALRESFAAAVREALRLMPTFNVDERIPFYMISGHLSQLTLQSQAFYVYEALKLPLRPFADQVLFRGSYRLTNAMLRETLGRLIESAPFEEMVYVYDGLCRNWYTDNHEYQEIKADLKKRIQPPMQRAMFLVFYRPAFGSKRTRHGRRTITTNAFPPDVFRRIVKMVFD